MKIAAYVHPLRCLHPLGGVGRHAAEVTRCLAKAPGVEVELFASKQWVDGSGRLGRGSALPSLPVRTFPWSESAVERCCKAFGAPKVDRWVGDADWIYSPMESYLPTKRVPVAITIHDVQAFETELPWSNTSHHRRWRAKWSVWIRKALRDSRVIFTVSEFSKGRIVELLGGDPEKIVVVGNGVSPEFFAIERRRDESQRPYVLVLGGLRWKKGGESVLGVARNLQTRGPGLRIVTVGLNDPDLIERAKEYPSVEVRDTVSESELRDLLGGAASLLFLSPYEGFGLPVLEAMAAGVPVVAANRASLPEAVGNAGVLVDPDEHAFAADVLVELERNRAQKQALVIAGRRRAAQFTWELCAHRVLDALRNKSV